MLSAFRLTDLMLLVTAAAIYGGIFPVNRLAAEAAWPPVGFAFMQSLCAGIVVSAVALMRRERVPLTAASGLSYLVIGGLIVGLPIGILVAAADHLDASVVTVVLCLSPILTLAFGVLLRLERFDWRLLAGMLLGTAGIVVITLPGAGVIGADAVGWFLLALVAPVMFASANVLAKLLRPEGASSLVMAAGTLLGAAVVSLLVLLVRGGGILPATLDAGSILPLALASLINAIFFWLFFLIVGRIGPARFSLFNYLAVAAGILWSLSVFGERPAAFFWLALLLMLLGMYLALSPRRDRAESQSP